MSIPVSYTHLDVYKRQDEQFGEVVAVLAPPAASPGLHDFAGFGQDFKAQDVYKRQPIRPAPFPCTTPPP